TVRKRDVGSHADRRQPRTADAEVIAVPGEPLDAANGGDSTVTADLNDVPIGGAAFEHSGEKPRTRVLGSAPIISHKPGQGLAQGRAQPIGQRGLHSIPSSHAMSRSPSLAAPDTLSTTRAPLLMAPDFTALMTPASAVAGSSPHSLPVSR